MSKTKDRPLISIGMPAFNEAAYIASAIKSILEQDFIDFELLISNNGSTDATLDIVSTFAARDSRVVVFTHDPALSALENFRFLLTKARASYFMFAGAHDLWSSNYIKALLATLQAHPNAKLAIGDTIYIDDKTEVTGKPVQHVDTSSVHSASSRALLLYKNMNRCNAFYGLFDRNALMKAMDLPYRIVNLDFLFLMHVAAQGDVISCHDAIWYRRYFRKESSAGKAERHASIFSTKSWALWFPLVYSRLVTIRTLAGFEGSSRERSKLVLCALWRMLFHPSQLRVILREFISGIYKAIR